MTKTKNTESELSSFDKFKKEHNKTSNKIDDYYTYYTDGRKSKIRTLLSYESVRDSLKLYVNDVTKIGFVLVEWNVNKGVIVSDDYAIANQDNNQMTGGDVETNRLLNPSAKNLWK